MANIYYTSFVFYSNSDVAAKVEKWQKSLRPTQRLVNLAEQKARLCKLFYSGNDSEIDFGALSVAYKGDFMFESRVSPPFGLQDRMLELLAEIDPNVVVGIFYNKDDDTSGYRYIVLDKNGKIYDNTHGEMDGFEFVRDENGDAENQHNNQMMIEFYSNQLEWVVDLRNDFKGSREYLKDEIKSLKKLISDFKKQKF